MLLVGGLEAWKREFGDDGVTQGTSSSGSQTPVLNGGISSSSSSSSMRYASPSYVRNRSGTESTLSSSFTSSDLGALNENPPLPPSMEPSPAPSYILPQPSEGGFRRGSDPFNRQVAVSSRSPPLNKTDFVRAPFCHHRISLLRLV